MLAGGARNGSDPVTVTANDNSGIRKVELIDVSNPAAPMVVGVEDYTIDRTGANKLCDFSQPAPCPGLTRETVRATSLPAGQRTVLVRVTDAGGNVVERGPYPVFAVTPSDRGALNGANATDTGTLSVIWTKGLQCQPAHARLRRQGGRPRAPDQQPTARRSPARRCCCSAVTCARAPR